MFAHRPTRNLAALAWIMSSLAAVCGSVPVRAQTASDAAVSEQVVPDDHYPARHVNFPDGVVGTPDLVYETLPGFRPLHLDLYQPGSEGVSTAHPFVIYVHGGGWMSGHTRQSGAFSNWPDVLASLAARGYVVASVEYRLSGEAPFPAAEQDIKAAIRWLRAHAADYGIDKTRGLIWGASAGGQLAALTATSCGVPQLEPQASGGPAEQPESDCVQAAVTWYGVFDFSTLTGQSAAVRYLGCRISGCAPGVAAAASPVTYIKHGAPPMLLVHGQMDKTVPVQQSQEFYDKLRAAGVPAQLLLIPDVDHSFLGKSPQATQAASRAALARVFRFIDETLKGTSGAVSAADPVRIESGAVAGKQLDSGVRAYFGLPFAAPPVRESRWREPQPVAPWQGVYMAVRKQPECIQNLRAHDINHYFGEEPTSEDCLYLNVWVPPAHTGNPATAPSKYPVVVWIYGGGFAIGSSAMANYDGEPLARKGVVFVSFNYRLGILGFLAHPELTAESPHHASGNYGFLDQVAALRWIQRNIASFGGDPGNVTLMGQSAGSMSIFQLQTSPLASGLFQRAIGMSGGPGLGPAAPSLQEGQQTGLKYQAALQAPSLAALRQLPADRLLAIQNQCIAGCPQKFQARPIVDGYFMPEPAPLRFASARQNDVPLVLGFAHDESWNPLMTARTVEQFRRLAQATFGGAAPEFLKLYKPSSDADVPRVAAQAVRDGGMASVMRTWARAQKQGGKSDVWVYVYSHPHPYAPGIVFSDHDPASAGAYHTSEVPYFLQTQDALNLFRTTREWTPYDRDLADEMSDCIVAFARSGNPATQRVAWPAYRLDQEQLVDFGARVAVTRLDTARMNFMATAHLPFVLGAPATGRRGD